MIQSVLGFLEEKSAIYASMYPYIKASVGTIDSASGRDGDIDSVLFLLALRHRALISAENGGKDVCMQWFFWIVSKLTCAWD